MSAWLAPQPFTEGMVVAVASSPEIPLPEQWMPWVLQVRDAGTAPKDSDLNIYCYRINADAG